MSHNAVKMVTFRLIFCTLPIFNHCVCFKICKSSLHRSTQMGGGKEYIGFYLFWLSLLEHKNKQHAKISTNTNFPSIYNHMILLEMRKQETNQQKEKKIQHSFVPSRKIKINLN